MFLTLQTWHEPEAIFALAGIAAFGRTEEDTEPLFAAQRDDLYRTYPRRPDLHPDGPRRHRHLLHGAAGAARHGDGGEHLLPPAVYGYILRNGLYGTGCGPEAPAA